jgi:hypothetical protein
MSKENPTLRFTTSKRLPKTQWGESARTAGVKATSQRTRTSHGELIAHEMTESGE